MRPAAVLALVLLAPIALADPVVLVVQGLGGNAHYEERFSAEVDAIESAARTLAPAPELKVFRGPEASREAILAYLEALGGRIGEGDLLYVWLVGHGSFDDEEYKFNIPGPDLTDSDILQALDNLAGTNQVVINTSSASGAAAERWQADGRVVITATRSGRERHATRFGRHFAEALSNPSADVDKNRIISAQEAFNFADRRVADHFEQNGSIPTEHARLDGERAARFSLARLDAFDARPDDARLAGLLSERDEISGRIDELRLARDEYSADEYQAELLGLMLELAEAEEAIEERRADAGPREDDN